MYLGLISQYSNKKYQWFLIRVDYKCIVSYIIGNYYFNSYLRYFYDYNALLCLEAELYPILDFRIIKKSKDIIIKGEFSNE